MRTSLFVFLLAAGLASPSVSAADATADTTSTAIAAKVEQDSCIDVQVDGYRTPSYDCLSKQMTPPQPAGSRSDPGQASGWVANAPSNQVGLYNQSSTSIRMGNTFGKSAFPQARPAPVPPPPFRGH
jgi:hypothetical protein